MANAISAVKDQFTSDAMRTAYNDALTTHSLPTLSAAAPILRHRRMLRSAARLPALAVELGEVEATDVGAGGLRAMNGVATLYLCLGRADESSLLDLAEQYIDALREAVEDALAGGFQRLVFRGAVVEGEAYSDAGVALRLVPVRFEYQWLYLEGEY